MEKIHKEAWHKVWQCECGEILNATQNNLAICPTCAKPKSIRKEMARAKQYIRIGLFGMKRYIKDKIMEIPEGEKE